MTLQLNTAFRQLMSRSRTVASLFADAGAVGRMGEGIVSSNFIDMHRAETITDSIAMNPIMSPNSEERERSTPQTTGRNDPESLLPINQKASPTPTRRWLFFFKIAVQCICIGLIIWLFLNRDSGSNRYNVSFLAGPCPSHDVAEHDNALTCVQFNGTNS